MAWSPSCNNQIIMCLSCFNMSSFGLQDIAIMEEELKTKSELIDKHKKLIEGWQKELKDQLGKHVTELERV